jgi:hypothetical protein
VLVIDIRPPFVDDIWVQRTNVRTADILPLTALTAYEETDPNAEISKNVNVYQNGAFNIQAKITEDDTTIKNIALKIYDSRYPNTELLSLSPSAGSSYYSPQWYLTEDMILSAGASVLPVPNYKQSYKNNNSRYYYRVRIAAFDKSDNESGVSENDTGTKIIEDQGYFCLWNKSDFPKGILDPLVVGGGTDITITKGSQLPVEFFDDDKIDWAYAALFTKEQWAGAQDISTGNLRFPGNSTNEVKFNFLKDKLLSGVLVYNWRYGRNNSPTKEPVVNLTPTGADEKTYYIETGNGDNDYGDFVFVSLVKDVKQPPHKTGEYPDDVRYRIYTINIVDENAPLIVFDKVGKEGVLLPCPEENTFPALSNGKFKIHGYTLREDKTISGAVGGLGTGGINKVEKFRLAWVPFDIASSDSTVESKVKTALAKPALNNDDFPAGVQYWDLSSKVNSPANTYVDKIGDSQYRKQLFSKEFDIMGGADDEKPTVYKNFTYKKNGVDVFENATKLFIFYAEDNMGHPVTTQFYLLGNKTPPAINIYEITDKLTTTPPAPSVYEDSLTGEITDAYIGKRKQYNIDQYPHLKNESSQLTDLDKTETLKVYPRGTTVKMWANATANGALAIKEIKMEDITYATPEGVPPPKLGYYKNDDFSLGYVEYFPEVTMRNFIFTATDQLGNSAQATRTISIANAATLTSITTTEQNGSYPAGKTIQLRANFDAMIKLNDNTAGKRPKLNIMYQIRNNAANNYGVQQIECEPLSGDSLYLTFNFTVPVNAQGRIETIYAGIPNKPTSNPSGFPTISVSQMSAIDRPITLTDGDSIIDAVNKKPAYTPGNVTGFSWTTVKNSLQYDSSLNPNGKNINLDGIAPVITAIKIIDTKSAYSASPNMYYLKSGDQISIELEASKSLKISGNASLRFRLQKPTSDGGGSTTWNTTAFAYRKVSDTKVVFTLDTTLANIGNVNHGKLELDSAVATAIASAVNITDESGNPITVSSYTNLLTSFNNANQIFFDLALPPKPVTTLTGTQGNGVSGAFDIGANPTTILNYSSSPYMSITTAPVNSEPYGAETRQYSFDGGNKWVTYPNAQTDWTTANTSPAGTLNISSGTWNIKTRYIDKAGNEGATTDQKVHVVNTFPKLLGINVTQPAATYIAGDTLTFTLDFDDLVFLSAPVSGVTLTLGDFSSTTDIPGGSSPSYTTNALPASATPTGGSRTVSFTWSLTADSKDMPNGLKVNAINISNLKDRYGNLGPANISVSDALITVPISPVNPAGYTVSYNIKGILVSTITPTIRSREPQNAQGRTGNITVYTADPETVSVTTTATGSISADNKTIKLNFSKPMQKGNGTITVRPHAGYAIPAVFEHEGYYIAYAYDSKGTVTGETRSATATAGSTYVSGFYDIFNSIGNTDRNTLIGGTLMSAPAVSNLTGLAIGPYQKTTHGLTQGAGYTGNYGNPSGHSLTAEGSYTIDRPGNNAPGTQGSNFMIPNVETKWVLAYTYDDLFSTATTGTLATVTNIRAVLDRAKFRWQEIPVTANNVTVNGNTVTIELSEPLLPGLQWDLYYTSGTFTDEAGNPAGGVTRGDYWFWSKGVQKPVIRVDRKSYDARAGGTNANYNGSLYNNGSQYNANGYNGAIASFNTIYFRITSETPQARIFYGKLEGADGTGSITAYWDGTVPVANSGLGITADTSIKWDGTKASAAQYIGRWVRPNLIFRNHRGSSENTKPDTLTAGRYYIMEDGFNVRRNVGGNTDNGNAFGGSADEQRYYGFRSYNKDATISELQGIAISNEDGANYLASVTGDFTYTAPLKASKNYVAARAGIDHTHTGGTYTGNDAVISLKGYEGVFRTVVAMNQAGLTANASNGNYPYSSGNIPMMISGSSVRSGLPTISNFPLRDGGHDSDSRFIKLFYRNGTGNNDKQFYWVTTEIVSQWYFQIIGKGNGGGSYSRMGDLEDWLSAGYGDLSYALNLATH